MRKKIAILECQLRKSEAARKRFEASAGKLLSFVEVNKAGMQSPRRPTVGPEPTTEGVKSPGLKSKEETSK